MARVLVGTLHHAENEFERCTHSLAAQRGIVFDHFLIANQPNTAAHEALYRRFMENAAAYDFFFKLDADMVLRGDDALALLVQRLEARPDASILMTDVADWPSQLAIPGVALYRSDCIWAGHDDALNVDAAPSSAHGGVLLNDGDFIAVDHMLDPSTFQMFCYGVHKALKALQPDRAEKDLVKCVLHTTILAGIARHWRETRDTRLAWALIGARHVFTGVAKPLLHDYAGVASRAMFEALAFDSEAEATDRFWRKEAHTQARWLNAALTTLW